MKFTKIILLTYFIFLNLLPVAKFVKMEIMNSCENKCVQYCNKQKSKEDNNPYNKQNCILNINLSTIFVFPTHNFDFSDIYLIEISEKHKYYFKEIILNDYVSKIWQPPRIIC